MAEAVATKVVRLETQMGDTKSQLNRVENKVDILINKVDEMALIKRELADVRDDINQLKSRHVLEKWLYPTLSAAFAVAFGYLFAAALHLRFG